MLEQPAGLYDKFLIQRVDGRDGPGGDREDARYFVLDYAHDPHARAALFAYATSCQSLYHELAVDLLRSLRDTRGGCEDHPMTEAEHAILPWYDKDAQHRAEWEAEQDRLNAQMEEQFRAAGYDPDGFYPPSR